MKDAKKHFYKNSLKEFSSLFPDGWINEKAVLRIAYSNKQDRFETCFKDCAKTGYETWPAK